MAKTHKAGASISGRDPHIHHSANTYTAALSEWLRSMILAEVIANWPQAFASAMENVAFASVFVTLIIVLYKHSNR